VLRLPKEAGKHFRSFTNNFSKAPNPFERFSGEMTFFTFRSISGEIRNAMRISRARAAKKVNGFSFSRSFPTNARPDRSSSAARNRKRYRNFDFGHGGQ
jgi:hypothetical protein